MAIFPRSASDGTRRRITTDNVKDNDIGTPPKETNQGSPASKENSVRAEMKRSRNPLIRTDGNDKNGDSSSSNLEEHREVLTTGYKKRRLTARSYRAYLNGKPARTENPDAGRIFPKMTNGEGEKTKADCLQWEDVEIPKLAESTLNNATSSSYPENQFPSRCSTCSMLQRENNDLQAGIFCSCNAKVGEGLSTSSEEGEPEMSGGNLTLTHLKDSSEAIQRDDSYIVCVICKLPGPLLFCGGKGCEACYHLACLDPPKSDVPPGLWLCFCCLRKKMEFGVHSVSEGFESIWDCNEEMQKEKHYFVKYKGLAHVHNRWIPESQLLHKDPMLLAKFNKKHQKEQVKKWKHEWTEPHRLLQKRFLIPPEQDNECSCGHGDNFEYCYLEWFVKWRCLGHEHATWEFENSPFLCSDEGKTLIKDYERRREDAKKASDPSRAGKAVYLKENLLRKLPRLPDGCPHELDNDHLESVSRILKCWHKNQNAVLIDDQERIVKSILFLLNLLPYTCGQFLIISTTSCLLTWEAEFVRLAPSINIVVYSGNRNVRKMIRDLEFYEEGGCIMFQVLLACPNDIVEDFDAFDCVNWEAIIIDDCQKSGVSKHLEQFTNLVSEFRLLLLNSLPKDNIVDYLKLLSVLEANGGEHSVNSLKPDSVAGNDALSILKGRLAQYVVYERKQNSSLFVEYWVPVQLSELQLKQYCSILASNSFLLRSRSRADCVQPLLDVLISIRKCCDHPYLADDSLQRSLTETLPVVEYLDIGVNASAKLQFLDKFLLEMKNRGLRVLILFQSNVGSGRNCMGDILDDFLHQRFGDKSFVYVDSRIDRSRTKAILQSFNEMGRDKFVIVIENLACRARIKLSSVDAIIIYDSDWNPLNDLKAIRKITIDSPAQQVKVFRLYSPYTVEEKVLMLAKEDGGLEVDIENTSTRLRHSLLSWGASQLFGKHNEFCKLDSSNALPKPFIDNLLLNAVFDLLTQSPENIDATVAGNCSNITEAHLSGASYSRNISLYGEKEDFSSVDGDPTHFWLKLLETSSSSPRYTSGPSPRIRRGVQFLDKFVKNPQTENYDLKKGRKLGGSTTEVFSKETWLQCRGQEAQGLGGTAVPDHTASCNANQPTLNLTRVTSVAEGIYSKKSEIHNFMGEPIEREKLLDEQKMHHDLLKPEMLQLCETLRFPENVMGTAEMFLKNILENHYVYQEPKSLLQAFILSLCWCAAFFSKHDMNHKESLELAKKYFNFECEEKQVEAIYEKLKLLNDSFSSLMGVSTNIVNLNPLKNQLHEPKTGGTEVLTRNGNSKVTSDDQDVEAREIKERSFCVSRKEPSCMKKVHHFSKDHTVGSSNPTSPILQEIVGGSQTFVPRNDVPKEFLQEGSGEMAASDHQEPEQGKSQPVVPSNDVVENLIGGVGSDILLFDYEEGEIREDPNIQAHEHEKKLQSLKDELLKRRISLIDEIYSARLDALISKQTKESTDFKNQMNQEKKNLVRTSGLDLEMILAANTDLEVNDDDMRKLQQEFSRKIDRFEQHMRSQRKKLLVMQIGARKKEKQLKEQWLEEAELGRSVESYDMLPLSATEFNLEKFREQVEAHDDSGNACSQGCSSDAITRSVGSVDISRSNAVQVTVPNEGMKQTSSEKEMSTGNSKTLIAVESSDQSRIVFDISTASLSRFPGDELLQNRTSSSQCNGGSGKAVGSGEPVEKNTIISDIVSANLSGGPADSLVQMMLPASQCNFSSGTAVDSTETSSEIPAITLREEMEYILTKKESPACQPRSVNAVEPSRTPPDISETVPCTGPGDKPLEPEALVSQPQILNVTGDDLGEVDITSGTPEGHRGGSETDGACLKSSLPSQNNNVSSIHALICAGSENSESQNQISSVELEILALSGSEPACSPPRSIAIPILDSGDQKLIQVENNNHIPEVSHSVLQQQPPSPNLNSVSASHQRTDAHIQSGLELIQVENSNHIPEASRPVLQQQQPPSAYLTSVSASHEWADAHIQSEQELILVENINHIPDASHPVLQQQPSSANLTSVSASHEWADEHIQSGQEFWNQVHCSDQVHVVSTLAPSVETVEMGRSSSSLSQSATLPVPIPIIAPENVHHRHLRIANIRQETVNHQQQTLFSNPLQFEMDRLGEEEKSLAQMLVGKKRDLQLKCEKELENVRKKYDALIQGEETLFTQKMEEIKKIQSIVEMNKHLAEEFSGIFFGNKQGTSAVSQGGPSSSPQQFIRSPRPSSSLPQFVRSPRPEVAQRPILASSSTRAPAPNPPRPPTPFSMGTLVPTFQPILNNSGILSNNLVMPHINPVQSHMNLHVRREPRAPAPHLRPFRSQSNTFPQNGNR